MKKNSLVMQSRQKVGLMCDDYRDIAQVILYIPSSYTRRHRNRQHADVLELFVVSFRRLHRQSHRQMFR